MSGVVHSVYVSYGANMFPFIFVHFRGVFPYFLKVAAPIVAQPISNLFNLSLPLLPIAWKAATVCPLFKGGDQADPSCYRPSSILSSLSKVFEKLANNQLTGFLDVYSILSVMQSGFRSGYGSVTATLKVLNDVTIALDSKHCWLLFLLTWSKLLIK